MKKSLRSIVAIAVLAFTMTPALHANQTGCNPHPQAATSDWIAIVAAVIGVLGM